MKTALRTLAIFALSTGYATLSVAQSDSGTGTTTRYWDCCKGSCSWPDKAAVSSPVGICSVDDSPLTDYNAESGCKDKGLAYMCSDQSPWAVSDELAYGFAAVHIAGGDEATWCCACYELEFTTTAIAGKKMIVQATNTGADLGEGQFDIALPGGGVGIYNGCTKQWGAPAQGWGAQYGGIDDGSQCSGLASALQPGCDFRFNWFGNANNPDVNWKKVTCPKALTDKTGCVRDGETPTEGDAGSSPSAAPSKVSSSTAEASPSSTAEVSPTSAAETSPTSSETAPVEPAETYVTPAAEPTSSTEAAPVESAPPAYTVPAASSSSEAAPVETPEATSYSAPAYGTGSSPAVPVGTGNASPSGYAPNNPDAESCEVQYVYEYDL